MAEDIWRDDDHAPLARVERELSDVGAGYLYRVHMDVHKWLGLPALPAAMVEGIYRTPHLPAVMSKAEDSRYRAGSRAAALFDELINRRRTAADATKMAEAVTENWYAHGMVADRAATAAAKANIIGTVQALGAPPASLPPDVQAWRTVADPARAYALEWAGAHAAEHCTRLRENTRHAVSTAVFDAVLAYDQPQQLAVRLGNTFGTLNRDWRRLAITEVAFARAHGFLSGLPDGSQVEWFAAADACPHCGRYHGQKFTVRKEPGDWEREVWPGKTNIGRSFAPKKADGSARGPDELSGPCIPLHPACRCRWLRAARVIQGTSDRLEAYLATLADS